MLAVMTGNQHESAVMDYMVFYGAVVQVACRFG